METRLVMMLSSVGLMTLAAALSYLDGTFLPSQMSAKHHGYSFSFVVNGATWGNLLLLSVALYIIGAYSDQWSRDEVSVAFVLGGLVSLVLFIYVYRNGKFPDSLAGAEYISAAGWVVMVYTGLVYAALGLFYFRTDASVVDVLKVWALLALYIPIANHAVLAYLNSHYYFPWCPSIFTEEIAPLLFIIGSEFLLLVATMVKTGLWELWWERL